MSPAEHCAGHPAGDSDGDGYADPVDKCPTKPENYNGYQDEDGCPDDPDSDGDGIADSRDQCELSPEDKDAYLDGDGCPEPDNDLDGLLDAADKCPNDPEDLDGYEDEDGCPDPDNDKDTVPDVTDQCPNEIGSATQEPLGCPGNRLAVVTDCEVKITQQIHFETNKDKIRPESLPGARRRGGRARAKTRRSRWRSRVTPTTRARPPTIRTYRTAAPSRS